MALRMLLVTIVVTMSLPIPDLGTCHHYLAEINQELAGIASSLRNEIPVSPLKKQQAQPEPKLSVFQNPLPASPTTIFKSADQVVATSPIVSVNQAMESPSDLAFELIQDEFAREATEFTLQEAKNTLARIQIKAVDHALPPAPPAEEFLHSEPILKSLEASHVIRVMSPAVTQWENLSYSRLEQLDIPIADQPASHLANSVSLGDWSQIVTESCGLVSSADASQSISNRPESSSIDLLEDPGESQWLAVVSINRTSKRQIDELETKTSSPSKTENQPKVVVRKALKLTAEAIAAWTQIVSRSY